VSLYGQAADDTGIIAKGATPKLLSDAFSFTEGPAADAQGNVYFTDQPNDRIYKWAIDGKLSLWREKTGRANGLYFDRKGHLLACSDADNEMWLFDADGNHRVLIADFDGKKLNGPNDLWIAPNGGIYFTDPLYARNYWTRDPNPQQDGQHVYYRAPNGQLTRVADDLQQPNGIIGTPDGKRLYVADIRAGKTYSYDICKDGTLANKTLFAPSGSDGMTIDSKGNVYLTGKGVTVFNKKGEKIAHIPIDAQWTANVCFGGKDRKTLFITASKCLYSLKMNVKGVK
jgi:gluconolactonase